MKSVKKSFLVSVLATAILCTLITVPAFAETATGVFYSGNFDNYSAGAVWDAKSFPSSQIASVDAGWSSEMMFASKTDNAGGPLNGGDRDAASIVERGNGGNDKAFRFGKTESGTNSYNIGANLYPTGAMTFTKGEQKVLHVSFDMLAEDQVAEKYFNIRRGTDKSFCQIVRFATNGQIYVWNDYWSGYSINEWYNFDIYFDFDANRVYLCEDGKLVKAVADPYFPGNSYVFDIFRFVTNTKAVTGMRLDNLEISVINKADAVKVNTAASYKSHMLEPFYGFFENNTKQNVIKMASGKSSMLTNAGVFGKRDSDKSLYAGAASPAEGGTSAMIDTYVNPTGFEVGDTIHYSTLLAIGDDSPATKIVRLHASPNVDLLTIASGGLYVRTPGVALPSMQANQWYRYDFVIKTGSVNYMDVYVNGTKAASDVVLATTISATSEITTRYTVTEGAADGYYADDVALTIYGPSATLVSPEVTLTNSNVSIKGDRIVGADPAYTVGDFIEDTTSSVPFEVRNSEGYAVDSAAPLAGNNVVLFENAGGEVYLPVYADGCVFFENNFDTQGGILSLSGASSQITVGGKGRSDNANLITVGDAGSATLTNKTMMYFNTDKVTVEASVLSPSVSGSKAVFYLKEFDDSSRRPVVTFAPDGKILCSNSNSYDSGKDSGLTWSPGLWYHVSASFNINEGGGEVFINGKSLGYLNVFSKGAYVHSFGLDATGVGTVVGIDNIKVYDGEYDATGYVVEPITTTIRPLLIDNNKRDIHCKWRYLCVE